MYFITYAHLPEIAFKCFCASRDFNSATAVFKSLLLETWLILVKLWILVVAFRNVVYDFFSKISSRAFSDIRGFLIVSLSQITTCLRLLEASCRPRSTTCYVCSGNTLFA